MSVLIKDTTREEREKIVKDGIALSMLGCSAPDETGMAFVKKYIDGEMELDEITALIIAHYKKSDE